MAAATSDPSSATRPPRRAPKTTPAAIASTSSGISARSPGRTRRRQARRSTAGPAWRQERPGRLELRPPDERRRCRSDGEREHDRRESRTEGDCGGPSRRPPAPAGRPMHRSRSARRDRRQLAAPLTAGVRFGRQLDPDERVLAPFLRVDERAERPGALDGRADLIDRQSEMLADQAIADAPDPGPHLRSPRASTARSHSVSTPIDRCEKLADPIRTSSSSTIITFEWTKVATSRARDAAGYTRRSRLCAIRGDELPEDVVAKGARSCSSRASRGMSCGVTITTSGPSGSLSRARQRGGQVRVREVLVLDVDVRFAAAIESRNSASHSRTAGSVVRSAGTVRAMATSTSVRSGVTSEGQRSSRGRAGSAA